MRDLTKHPSGRPIRKDQKRGHSIYRSPGIGPLVPRLQLPKPQDAIGFHRFVIKDDKNE